MRPKTMRILPKVLGMAGALWLLASAAMAQPGAGQFGRLKVCKVAGPGVPVGTIFTITADNKPPFTVKAGPAPGGYCTIGPTFAVGSTIPITEFLANGNQVTGITVDPPGQLVSISGNTVNVTIGNGVTEVIFKNKRTGYLEICKTTEPKGGTGNYTFYVNPGWLGPFTVPVGSCSPAIEVPAGTVTIHEVLGWGVQLVGCSVLPGSGGSQLSCNTGAGISTVTVAPGNVSNQTIAIMTNKAIHGSEIENPTDPTSSMDATEPR